MNIEVKILRNENGKPAGKRAGAEIHFIAGELAGLKLVGFASGKPAPILAGAEVSRFRRANSVVHGDKRNFALLRAIDDPAVLARVREVVLHAYHLDAHEVDNATVS